MSSLNEKQYSTESAPNNERIGDTIRELRGREGHPAHWDALKQTRPQDILEPTLPDLVEARRPGEDRVGIAGAESGRKSGPADPRRVDPASGLKHAAPTEEELRVSAVDLFESLETKAPAKADAKSTAKRLEKTRAELEAFSAAMGSATAEAPELDWDELEQFEPELPTLAEQIKLVDSKIGDSVVSDSSGASADPVAAAPAEQVIIAPAAQSAAVPKQTAVAAPAKQPAAVPKQPTAAAPAPQSAAAPKQSIAAAPAPQPAVVPKQSIAAAPAPQPAAVPKQTTAAAPAPQPEAVSKLRRTAEGNMLQFGLEPILPYSIEEAINRLRINISFLGNDVRKIMVISSEPNEGKSFVALNLWKQMALAGEPSILVDMDMRKSVMVTKYQMKREDGQELKGTSHFLSGDGAIEDMILRTKDEHGDILPNVDNIVNPSMLLESRRFSEMLQYMEEHYRYVFIDAPPLGLVSDGELIGNVCDGAVLCVRGGVTSRSIVRRSIRQLERAGCPVLGIVLNRVGGAGSTYYHKYYGKKYYGYGNKYYYNDQYYSKG